MIQRTKKTVILLRDQYPGYDMEESQYIEKILTAKGYYVVPMTVDRFLYIENSAFTGMSGQIHHAFMVIVPSAQTLPIESINMIKDYSETRGSVLFLGGPVFYDMVKRDENNAFVKVPIEGDFLDANTSVDNTYIREGIAPTHKTFVARDITKLTPSANQTIFQGDLALPETGKAICPCETNYGKGYAIENLCRFIPLVDCYDDADPNDLIAIGRDNGRRGAFAFLELERTAGPGHVGKFDYGVVGNAQIGSAVAMIGYRDGIQNIKGGDALLLSIVDRLSLGLYLFSGGVDGIRFRKDEPIHLGAEIMNNTGSFKTVTCNIQIQLPNQTIEKTRSVFTSPKSIVKVQFELAHNELSLSELPLDVEFPVTVSLMDEGKTIDTISSFFAVEDPKPEKDPACYIGIDGDHFVFEGKPWYMAGINYWFTFTPSLERPRYWMGQFDKSNYNADSVERDLAYLSALGLNCVLTRLDFSDIHLIFHGLRDFLARCKKYNLRVWISCVKSMNSKTYDPEAVAYLFSKVHIAENPVVMALDNEWESVSDHLFAENGGSEFFDEWQDYLIGNYGSVQAAEAKYGITLPRDEYGFPTYPDIYNNRTAPLPLVQDMLTFTYQSSTASWKTVREQLKPLIPNQFISYRHGRYASFKAPAESIDFTPLECYWLGDFDGEDTEERNDNCVGYCVSWHQIHAHESGGKPVLWAEYNKSLCGTNFLPNTFCYDHENMCYPPEAYAAQNQFNDNMLSMMEYCRSAGSAPWWWCGGFRMTEAADFGYLHPWGLLTESARTYIAFCQRMKETVGQPDTREALVVEGNPLEYLEGKDDFVKEVCVPAYKKAKKENKRLEIRTHYPYK